MGPDQPVETFKITDKRGQQAFAFGTTKPPILWGGTTIPADQRSAPDPASWLIFNDENGDERGGLVASSNRTFLSMDYTNCDALNLGVDTTTENKTAGLTIRSMPDPNLPLDQAWAGAATAAQIGWTSNMGSCLALHDSQGRPRIVLSVDTDDVPHIQVLGIDGDVQHELI